VLTPLRLGATSNVYQMVVPVRLIQSAAVIRWRGPISVPVQFELSGSPPPVELNWAIARQGHHVVGLRMMRESSPLLQPVLEASAATSLTAKGGYVVVL
jgi:hypothetical protein